MTDTLHQLAAQMKTLFSQAIALANAEVDDILQSRDRDTRRIEHQLDHMLGFCGDPGMLLAYKRLCRYYFTLDPQATVDYVHAYREMWDSPEEAPTGDVCGQTGGAGCVDLAESAGAGV